MYTGPILVLKYCSDRCVQLAASRRNKRDRIAQDVDGQGQTLGQMAQYQLDWVIAELAKLPRMKTSEGPDAPENIVERVRGALQRANNRVSAWEWRARRDCRMLT